MITWQVTIWYNALTLKNLFKIVITGLVALNLKNMLSSFVQGIKHFGRKLNSHLLGLVAMCCVSSTQLLVDADER